MRRGFAIVLTLVMAAVISGLAMSLFTMANIDMQIAKNVRLSRAALLTSQSALNAFAVKGLHYEDVLRHAAGEKNFIFERGEFSARENYEIHVTVEENETFRVRTIGDIKKGDRVLASAQIEATFRSSWRRNEN